MRIYHKFHKNPEGSKRATLIRNIGNRVEKMLRKNPATHKEIFEEIFRYRAKAEGFHGLEVEVVGKTKLRSGGSGYVISHPWFPAKTGHRLKVRVCSTRYAKEIGIVSVKPLSSISRFRKPKLNSEEGTMQQQIGEFCCLTEEPETPLPGQKYGNAILICGERRTEPTRIGVGKYPELAEPIQEIYHRLEVLDRKELELLDKVSKAREAYLAEPMTSRRSEELKKELEKLRTELFTIQGKKKETKEKISRRGVTRPEAFRGKHTATTKKGLEYRYGGEEAERLAGEERAFREEFLMKTGGKLRHMGRGRGVPINERFTVEDTPLIGVIWDEVVVDPLRGYSVGKKGLFTWEVFDSAGKLIQSGTVKKTGAGGGKARAAQLIKSITEQTMKSTGSQRGTVRAASPGTYEAATIQESIISKRPAPSLEFGEHLIAQFIPQEKIKVTKRGRTSDWRDVMRWGLPTPYGLAEFYRDMTGYHVTLKFPSGVKHRSMSILSNMTDAVEYAILMMKDFTGIKKWAVEEGPRWTDPRARGRASRSARRNPGYGELYENPSIMEILAPPFLLRPKRKRAPFKVSEIDFEKKAKERFEFLRDYLPPKEAFDFGFMFGVLRGIDTCGVVRVAERRRIRREVEQQVLDAVYELATKAPRSNPGEEVVEMFKDIVAPPGISRPKRAKRPVTVEELPDLKPYFLRMAEEFSGEEGFDFGFVFGVLRGIDTCGMTNLFERRRIRRTIEQSIMGMIPGA